MAERNANKDPTRKPYQAKLQANGTLILDEEEVLFTGGYWKYRNGLKTVSSTEFRPADAFKNFSDGNPPDRAKQTKNTFSGEFTWSIHGKEIHFNERLQLWHYLKDNDTYGPPVEEEHWSDASFTPGGEFYRLAIKARNESEAVVPPEPGNVTVSELIPGAFTRTSSKGKEPAGLSRRGTPDTPQVAEGSTNPRRSPDDSKEPERDSTPDPDEPDDDEGRDFFDPPNPPPPPPSGDPEGPPNPSTSTSNPMSGNGKTDLNKPKPFNGSSECVNIYVVHCALQFALNPTQFDSDQKKNAYLLSFCTEGIAAPWAEEVFPSWMGNLKWEAAKKQFKDKFLPANLKTTALVRMKALRQWHFLTFEEFLVEFKQQQQRTGITDVEVLRLDFLNSLHQTLKQHLMGVDPANVDTLEKLYDKAREFECMYQNYHVRRQEQYSDRNRGQPKKNWNSRRNQPRQRVSRLTPAEAEAYKKAGRCFGCGQTGHMVKQCPRRGQRVREITQAAAAVEDPQAPVEQARRMIERLDTHDQIDNLLMRQDF